MLFLNVISLIKNKLLRPFLLLLLIIILNLINYPLYFLFNFYAAKFMPN